MGRNVMNTVSVVRRIGAVGVASYRLGPGTEVAPYEIRYFAISLPRPSFLGRAS